MSLFCRLSWIQSTVPEVCRVLDCFARRFRRKVGSCHWHCHPLPGTCRHLQAAWRASTCRKRLKQSWASELDALLRSPQLDGSEQSPLLGTRAVALFLRAYDPKCRQQLPVIANLSERAFAPRQASSGKASGVTDIHLVTEHAKRLCWAIVSTLSQQRCATPCTSAHLEHAYMGCEDAATPTSSFVVEAGALCREHLREALAAPLFGSIAAPEQQQAQVLCRALHAALAQTLWVPASTQACTPVADILQFLHRQSVVVALTPLVTTGLAGSNSTLSEPSAGESIANAFLDASAEHAAQLRGSSQGIGTALLLTVPRLFHQTAAVSQRASFLLRASLQDLDVPPSAVQAALSALADPTRSTLSPAVHVAHSALWLLSNLLTALHLCPTQPTSSTDAVVCLRSCRTLIALMPVAAREAVVTSSVRMLQPDAPAHFSIPSSLCASSDATQSFEAAEADFSGADWLLPAMPPPSSPRATLGGSTRMEVDGEGADDHGVEFKASLVSPQLVARLATSALQGEEGGEALLARQRAANELALWVSLLLALSSCEDLAHKKLQVAWGTAAVELVGTLWARVLAPALAVSVEDAGDVGQPVGVPSWALPMTVLCTLYSHYASTVSDSVLFSEEVRLPLQSSRRPLSTAILPATERACVRLDVGRQHN